MTTSTTPNPEPTQAEATREDAVKAAYSAAASSLREKYRDEFNADVRARVEAAGFTWSPRPTAAEKAKAKIEALLAENPDLAPLYTGVPVSPVVKG